MSRKLSILLALTFSAQVALSQAAMRPAQDQVAPAVECCHSQEQAPQSCCEPVPEQNTDCCLDNASALPASALVRSGDERNSKNILKAPDSSASGTMLLTHVFEIDPSKHTEVLSPDKVVLFCNFQN